LPSLPTGTVTFLFTDIEGSTTLLQRFGDRRYAEVLAEHQRLLRAAFAEGHGQEIDTQGDAFLVAFSRARDAVAAAVAAQQALTKHPWPDGASLRVRMGLHTGEPISEMGGYVGLDVHRAARVCAAGHGGQILVSQAVGVLAAPDLPPGVSLRDLGVHRLKDLKEPEHLYQAMHLDLPGDFPPLKSLDARPNNLPIQLTSFVGRAREIAEVKGMIGAARLLTLTGSGGAGKTRLALRVAADVTEDHPDGVWLAEFAAIADPALVPKTVASALNVPEQPGRDITETLVDALRPKALLLVLDNCEHLLMACRDLAAALLRKCPQVRILATSREGLGVPGETLWRVPSLSVPEDLRHLPPSEELVLYDAVRLFVDRAVTTTPEFTVTRENAPAVAQVCQRLDGIPLAIELAAARVKVLAVDQIAARLDDRFRLLTGGSPIALHRQQTLRATIDWSYNLLSETERVLLRRLSVFVGGWTLEAAESVCADGGVEAASILDLLTALVDKSLMSAETQRGEARYRLLETVRQYAHDRLVEADEDADLRTRHRDWYLELAEQTDREIRGPRPAWWIERLETEHDNLRSALEWSKAEKDGAEAGLRLVGALHRFWFRRGHWREASEWLDGALARSGEAPPSLRPKALLGATHLAWRLGDYGLATKLGEKGVALCRELEDKEASASLLTYLSVVAIHQGNYDRATALCEEAMNLGRELGNKAIIGLQLGHLGIVARYVGDYERATALQNESLALLREIGDKSGITFVLPFVLRNLGKVALHQSESGRAAVYFRESLILSTEIGDRWLCEEGLEGFAAVASATGHYERAARLLGAADQLREILGWHPSPPDQADYDKCRAATHAALGNIVFSVAWAEGRAMTLEQAIEYALASGRPSGTV
jgi:predicted ATPase/class 3 adenylate cyclase